MARKFMLVRQNSKAVYRSFLYIFGMTVSALRKIKIVYRLVGSFIILLSLSLLLAGIISYNKSSETINSKISNSSIKLIELVANNLQSEIEKCKVLTDEIMFSEDVQKLLNMDKMESLEKVETKGAIAEYLNKKRGFSPFIQDISIITNNAEILNVGGFFISVEWKDEERNKLVQDIAAGNGKVSWILDQHNENAQRSIIIGRQLKSRDTTKSIGVLLLFLSERHFSNFSKNVNIWDGADVFIIDCNSTVVSSRKPDIIKIGEEYKERQLVETIKSYEGTVVDKDGNAFVQEYFFKLKIDGVDSFVVYKPIRGTSWFITAVVPYAYLQKESKSIGYFIFLVTVFCAFVAILFAILISYSISSPLKKLLKEMADENNEGPLMNTKEKNCDEIAQVLQKFNSMLTNMRILSSENSGLQIKLKSKAGMLKEQFLWKLLHGTIENSEELGNMYDLAAIKLELPMYAVMIISIDDIGRLKTDKDKKLLDLIKFSVINVAEELALDIGQGYGLELADERCVALLLNLKEHNADEAYLGGLAYKIKNFFTQHFNLTFTIGVGRICSDLRRVRESCLEANRAVYYRMVKGNDNVIFYEDAWKYKEEEYKYPADLETALVTAMKRGMSNEVVTVTRKLKGYIENQSLTPEAVQCICFGIINAVMKCLDEMDIEIKDCFVDRKDTLYSIPFETLDELGNRIVDFCSKVCNYIEKQKESRNYVLRDRILAVIKQRYTDNTLNMERIADECGISTSYLSRYFKDQTGYLLRDYIDTIRINEAKKLLKNTHLPLRNILDQTGYMDETNFIRKFKKKEGVTPMQYRSIGRDLK